MSLATTIAYSRPPAVGLPKPKAPPAPKPHATNPPGMAGGGRVPPGGRPRTAAASAPLNPYNAFTVQDPYDPAKINSLAQSGYNTDVASARTTSQMGYLTPEQITAQAQNRATQQTALGASLQAALAGIQQAYVTGGTANAAGLASTNAAGAATGARAAGLGGVAPESTAPQDAGVRAALADQTAAGGNLYGGLQAAALSSGSTAAKDALAAGDTLQQTTQQQEASSLAQLIAQIASPSTRSASMLDANQKSDAANSSTALSIWTGIENRRLQAQAEGDKKGEAAATLEERKFEAQQSSSDRRYAADESATTSTNNNVRTTNTSTYDAQLAAKTKKDVAAIQAKAKIAGRNAGLTPAAAASWAKGIVGIRNQKSGTQTKVPTTWTIRYQAQKPLINGVADPTAKAPSPASVTVSAADYDSGAYKKTLPKGAKVIGTAPAGTTAKTVNASSEWTRYKEALNYTMSAHPAWTRTQAVHALGQAGWPAPKSGGK